MDDDKTVTHANAQIGSLSVDPSQYVYSDPGLTTSSLSWHTSSDATTIATKRDLDDLSDRLGKIESRLAILDKPDQETLDNYQALKEAYDAYKVIEALIKP